MQNLKWKFLIITPYHICGWLKSLVHLGRYLLYGMNLHNSQKVDNPPLNNRFLYTESKNCNNDGEVLYQKEEVT